MKNTVSVNANLGAGNDKFYSTIWGDVSGSSDVAYDVQGGAGEDLLTVIHRFNNATGQFAVQIDPAAALRVHLDGGADADRVRVNCIERLFGTLDVDLEGGEGDVRASRVGRRGSGLWISVCKPARAKASRNLPTSHVQLSDIGLSLTVIVTNG